MRVFLKSMAGPMATAPPRDEPPKTNGNGGAHGPGEEASAFHELLTEFRNLTERYGQALLALGEARGEVAGLRSRVELLEARLDFRLPASSERAPVASGYACPEPAEPDMPEPPTPVSVAPPRPRAARPTPAKPKLARGQTCQAQARPRASQAFPSAKKPQSTRSAMTGFADALARAQDPAVADVGDSLPTEDAIGEATAEMGIDVGFEPNRPGDRHRGGACPRCQAMR